MEKKLNQVKYEEIRKISNQTGVKFADVCKVITGIKIIGGVK